MRAYLRVGHPRPVTLHLGEVDPEAWMATRDLKIPQQRHPEKAHRPDNAQPKKPDWIRVKAPTSEGYK